MNLQGVITILTMNNEVVNDISNAGEAILMLSLQLYIIKQVSWEKRYSELCPLTCNRTIHNQHQHQVMYTYTCILPSVIIKKVKIKNPSSSS